MSKSELKSICFDGIATILHADNQTSYAIVLHVWNYCLKQYVEVSMDVSEFSPQKLEKGTRR